jgi:hypothetical protein
MIAGSFASTPKWLARRVASMLGWSLYIAVPCRYEPST